MALFAIAAASIALLQSSAVIGGQSEPEKLQACINRIETDPDGAYEDGLAWLYQGNRPAARQCTALALIALGRADEGAARLESLANAPDGGSMDQRFIYLTQAGNAWMQAGAPEAAIVTLTNAIKLKPQNADLYIDRASAHLMLREWDEGIKDLDTALEMSPGDAQAHQLRAEARLNMGDAQSALKDVESSLAADPENIDTLVLRGRVREAIRLADVTVLEPAID